MRKYLSLALAATMLITSCASVRLSKDESSALRAVEHFVHLDRSGARLDANRRHAVDAALTSPENTAWDCFVVISSWRYNHPQTTDDAVVVEVHYVIEGLMSGETFIPTDVADPETAAVIEEQSTIKFTAMPSSDKWRIETPTSMPHVSFAVARQWAESLASDAALQELRESEYTAKLKRQRASNCNCGRLDF